MSKLKLKQIFGYSSIASKSLSFCEDHQLVYISGNQVCVLNTDSKEQNFIHLHNTPTTGSIPTTLACCHAKRIIAVAERIENSAIVSFYDSITLKKKKSLHQADLGSNHVVSIAFSEDGRQFITQGAGPEWNLILWNVEKQPKIVATYRTTTSDEWPVNHVEFCPWDHSSIIVYGRNVFKVLKMFDGGLRNQNVFLRRDFIHVKAHCWLLNDRLILATDAGEMILLENLEYRGVVFSPPIHSNLPSPRSQTPSIYSSSHNGTSTATTGDLSSSAIYSIVPTSRGFIVGGKKGELRLFERRDDSKEYYTREDTCYLPDRNGAVTSMILGSDDTLICATGSLQLVSTVITNLFNKRDSSTSAVFEPVLTSFHSPDANGDASITGVDIALWKNIVVTCARDRSVRLWNLSDRKIEMMRTYDEEPLSVSIHPSGLHMAIAFADKLSLVSILMDELTSYAEISIRSCAFVKFSHGGHYLAVVAGSSIYIYDTFTATVISTLRGHANKIRSVVWMHSDTKLMSVGVDGMVFYWTPFTLTSSRPLQYNHPSAFLCGSTLQDGSRAFVVTNERVLKEFSFSRAVDPITGIEGKIRDPRDTVMPHLANHIIVNETYKCLILASSDPNLPGALMSVNLDSEVKTVESIDCNIVHAGPISAMVLSSDGKTLITGDSKGCLIVSEFLEDGIDPSSEHIVGAFAFVDEVQIKRSQLSSRNMQISTLSSRVNELNLNNDFQIRLKEMEFNETVKDLTNKFQLQYKTETERYEILLKEKKESEGKFIDCYQHYCLPS
jgi:cilia- and flagella-associated protein 57